MISFIRTSLIIAIFYFILYFIVFIPAELFIEGKEISIIAEFCFLITKYIYFILQIIDDYIKFGIVNIILTSIILGILTNGLLILFKRIKIYIIQIRRKV